MGLLTRATTKLSALFQEFSADLNQPITVPQDEDDRKEYIRIKKAQLKKIKKSFEMSERNVDNALTAYTNAADQLEEETPQLKTILERGEVATNPTDTDAVAPDTQEGVQNWERFLALEGAGIQDFSGTKAKEQETVDRMHSFYKTVGTHIMTTEQLTTLMIEIEGSLNSRPLTYQGELYDELKPLRPIDFIASDIEVTYPFENLKETGDDSQYLPAAELVLLQTRQEAEAALVSSQKATERFWEIWHKMYLSSLREAHKLSMDQKHTGNKIPTVGTVVLIADQNVPRNSWRMGRIIQLTEGSDSAVREALLRTSTGKQVRRPVNLLVPLELAEEPTPSPKATNNENQKESPRPPAGTPIQVGRYNFRKRPKVNYDENQHEEEGSTQIRSIKSASIPLSTLLTCLSIILMTTTATSAQTTRTSGSYGIRCIMGGVEVERVGTSKYEVCTEKYCILRENPPSTEKLLFPPELTVHKHTVRWKRLEEGRVTTGQLTCPPAPFCQMVQCWFCTATMFNPECNPQIALIAYLTLLYIMIAVVYTLCYVPVIIGKPCRIAAHILLRVIQEIFKLFLKALRTLRLRRRRNRRAEVQALLEAPLIASVFVICLAGTQACQDVDIFTLPTTSENEKGEQTEEHVFLLPSIPLHQGKLRLTLSSLTVPPTPILNTQFITNGEETAIWSGHHPLTMECESRENAKNLSCSVTHNCICQPAELRILCSCTDNNITALFKTTLETRLPVRQPWVFFDNSKREAASVSALVPTLVTAELLVTLKEDIHRIDKEVANMTCTIADTTAYGCYRCEQGAIAEVTCFSSETPTRAEVHCQDHHFSVPCSREGNRSELRFSQAKARVSLECITACGSKTTYFVITGTLKWTKSMEAHAWRLLRGESFVPDETGLPDISHIFDIIISGYKTVFIAAACFLVALVAGYLFIWTCGVKILSMVVNLLIEMAKICLRLITRTALGIVSLCKSLIRRHQQEHHTKQM
ncbi:hypothetical protein GCK32_003874 [Trichostrongylus colubriformis]|uniref:Phlebovirus glycoprotein G2 fusion domain-containing protein n=1 Tax=Trichostrongylus colubriformis TaxID=6319 RepID=A0AAN8IC76_TRICO